MSEGTAEQPLASEKRVLADAYASLNRGDVAGFVRCFDDDVERIEQFGFPNAGTYRGRESVRAHVEQGRSTWAEGSCQPQQFIVAGGRIVVVAHVHVRLHGKADWIEGDVTDVFTFRDGKVTQYCSFGRTQDALAFAGVEASGG